MAVIVAVASSTSNRLIASEIPVAAAGEVDGSIGFTSRLYRFSECLSGLPLLLPNSCDELYFRFFQCILSGDVSLGFAVLADSEVVVGGGSLLWTVPEPPILLVPASV